MAYYAQPTTGAVSRPIPQKRRKQSAALAPYNSGNTKVRTNPPRVIKRTPQPTTGTGSIPPQVIGSTPQPTTGAVNSANRVLRRRGGGPSGGVSLGDRMTGATGVNPGVAGGLAPGYRSIPRAGKTFRIGYTADGRIVHLYGADVPAGSRRVVLKKKPRSTNLNYLGA